MLIVIIASFACVATSLHAATSENQNELKYSCGFEKDRCEQWFDGYSSHPSSHWKRSNRVIYTWDKPWGRTYHIRGWASPYYIEAIGLEASARVQLKSLQFAPGRFFLSFRHSVSSFDTGRLLVYREWADHMDLLMQVTKYSDRLYREDTVKFDCQVPCKIIFEARKVGSSKGHVAIDAVNVKMTPYVMAATPTPSLCTQGLYQQS